MLSMLFARGLRDVWTEAGGYEEDVCWGCDVWGFFFFFFLIIDKKNHIVSYEAADIFIGVF